MDAISNFLGADTSVDYSKPLPYSDSQRKEIITKVDDLRDTNSIDDYEFVRENLRKIICEGMGLVPDVISLARESEKTNYIDSVSALLSTMASINKDLLDINKIDSKGKSQVDSQTITNNTAIICSTEDMLKRITQSLTIEQ